MHELKSENDTVLSMGDPYNDSLYLRTMLDQLRIHHKDGSDTPLAYICPLSHQIMIDPVVIAGAQSEGYTYDRAAINSWFQKCVLCPDLINDGVPEYKIRVMLGVGYQSEDSECACVYLWSAWVGFVAQVSPGCQQNLRDGVAACLAKAPPPAPLCAFHLQAYRRSDHHVIQGHGSHLRFMESLLSWMAWCAGGTASAHAPRSQSAP